MRTVIDAITANADGTGTLAIIAAGTGTPTTTLTWAEIHLRARQMASAMADTAGVRRCGRVGVLGDTSASLVIAIQAAWLAGASVTVLPWPARRVAAHTLRPVIVDAGLDLVVVDAQPDAGMATALAPTRVLTLRELARRARSAVPAAVRPPDPADLAVLQYTSGSTRSPRGVPVTHGQLAANLDALREALHPVLRGPQPMLTWLPLYHDMGLIGFLTFPMAGGHPLVLQPPSTFALRPASWLEALSRHRGVVTGAPDSAYRIVTPLLEAGLDVDLSAVRLMLSGGEPISTETMGRFLAAATRHGLDPGAVVPAYGLAEATLAVTCARPGAGLTTDTVDPDQLERDGRATPALPAGPARTLARLGRPVPGTRVRIVDRHTRAPAGEREVGEVEVQGASVVGHYWREPPPAAGTWLRTGDLGYLAEGDLVLCGRAKDVLFAGGRNLYPPDIETVAGQVPQVRPGGAVAFGIPSEQGDRLVVMVETRSADRPALCRAVTVAVTAGTGMRPAEVIALPPGRLPRTTSGKLRRSEARSRYQRGEVDRPSVQKGRTDDHARDPTGAGPVTGRATGLAPAGTRGTP